MRGAGWGLAFFSGVVAAVFVGAGVVIDDRLAEQVAQAAAAFHGVAVVAEHAAEGQQQLGESRIKVSGTFIGHSAALVLTQAMETRDVTYDLHNQIEFTNGVTQTTVQETRTDSASSLLDGTSATEHVQYAQNRWHRKTLSGSDDGNTATRRTTSEVISSASGQRDALPPVGSGSPSAGQVVSAWVSLNGSSNSDITNTGVRDPNAPGSMPLSEGDYSSILMVTPGWTWTNTGSQSSTLNETVGETRQSMPDLMTGTPVAFTNQTQLERTTSATELSNSATVLRTSTGSSTLGSSWSGTSTVGTFTNPGESGISMRAHALVPVGSDGLSYAYNNNPTNYVGDYAWLADDILVGSTTAPPEAQAYTRNFGSPLATQKTLTANAGASTTNNDNAGSAGSSSGTTSYGTGGSSRVSRRNKIPELILPCKAKL